MSVSQTSVSFFGGREKHSPYSLLSGRFFDLWQNKLNDFDLLACLLVPMISRCHSEQELRFVTAFHFSLSVILWCSHLLFSFFSFCFSFVISRFWYPPTIPRVGFVSLPARPGHTVKERDEFFRSVLPLVCSLCKLMFIHVSLPDVSEFFRR